MATDFQTKEVKDLGTSFTNLTGSYSTGEVTVHAIYVSNKNADYRTFYLSLFDNAGTPAEKASILYNVDIAPKSSLVVEKPINLTTSTTNTDQRQLRVKASHTESLDVVASVLVIT